MSFFKDPFDPKALLGRRCGCGGNHAAADHARLTAEAVPAGEEARWNRVVDAAVLQAVFPVDAQRRLFLKTVGASTALAAIYRFYELVQVYGTTWKELIQEEFGDGIMSAIDFDMTMERQPDQKGDRVKIAMSGKFLGYKTY